jgi:beta-galactosidase
MISPGGKVRREGEEALLLARLIAALGPALALAAPLGDPPVPVNGVVGHALALEGGGCLVGLPNLGEEVAHITLGAPGAQFPVHAALPVAPNTCPFVLLDYPLAPWRSAGGRLVYATAELVDQQQRENDLVLTFALATGAEVVIHLPGATIDAAPGWQVEGAPTGWRLWTDGAGPAEAAITDGDGKRLVVKALNRAEVADLRQAGLDEHLLAALPPQSAASDSPPVSWRLAPLDPCAPAWFAGAKPCPQGKLYLEENDIWRGFGWYQADSVPGGAAPIAKDVQGFLVHSGADVLSLYLGGHFLRTVVPGGGDAFVPLPQDPDAAAGGPLVVRSEIWGHCNFDDHRLPALRLNSLRGMGGLAAVRSIQDITGFWFYHHRAQAPAYPTDPTWPYIPFGGW